MKIQQAALMIAIAAATLAFGGSGVGNGVAHGQARTLTNCEGNACGEVQFRWTGSCYDVTNNGRSVVTIRMGNVSFDLAPGDTQTPGIPPYCVQSFIGSPQANYR